MIEFFHWFSARGLDLRPWLVLGKGPTFSDHEKTPLLDQRYKTVGLNHVCRERPVFLSHVIDLEVLDEIPGILDRTLFLVMPYHPHVGYRATKIQLPVLVEQNRILSKFEAGRRLLWYNLSSWPEKPEIVSPVIRVHHFSAEAAIRLLATAGVMSIRTLGIGGEGYAKEFSDLTVHRGGNDSFRLQKADLDDVVRETKIDLQPLRSHE